MCSLKFARSFFNINYRKQLVIFIYDPLWHLYKHRLFTFLTQYKKEKMENALELH